MILLTYNHERYIEQALGSVLSQQADFPIEVILTEDRSTDRTGALVETAAARHPDAIRLVRSSVNLNTNVVTTRAIDLARGDYLAFLDGDDFWTAPDKLQRQVAFLDANPQCAICFHDVVLVGPEGEVIDPSFQRHVPVPPVSRYEDIVRRNYIAGPSPMIRRSAVAHLPGWFEDSDFGDWPLYMLAAEHGTIGFLPEALAAYRKHGGGYWNGLSEVEQTRRLVTFLAFVWRQVPRQRRAAVEGALAGLMVWADLPASWRLSLREDLAELWQGAPDSLRWGLDLALAEIRLHAPAPLRPEIDEALAEIGGEASSPRRRSLDRAMVALHLERALWSLRRLRLAEAREAAAGAFAALESQGRPRMALVGPAWTVLRARLPIGRS